MDTRLHDYEKVSGGRELSPREQMDALAHALWMDRGCPVGSPEVDWFEAERRLIGLDESAKAQQA